jgi:hypothetical protein
VFGIDSSSREYQRWRRNDGFRHVDFEIVLGESRCVLTVDWQEWLQEAINTITGQLEALGLEVTTDLDEEGNEGVIQIDGQPAQIKFVPVDGDDFDLVIATINSLIAAKARYRRFRSCEGSDGWAYAILKNENWRALDATIGATIRMLFE